jgi:hypothetical protein
VLKTTGRERFHSTLDLLTISKARQSTFLGIGQQIRVISKRTLFRRILRMYCWLRRLLPPTHLQNRPDGNHAHGIRKALKVRFAIRSARVNVNNFFWTKSEITLIIDQKT